MFLLTNVLILFREVRRKIEFATFRYPVAEIESNYVERIKIDPTNAMKQTVRAKGKLDSFYKGLFKRL